MQHMDEEHGLWGPKSLMEPQLCHLGDVCLGLCYSPSLFLGFLVCQMGEKSPPHIVLLWGLNEWIRVRTFQTVQAQNKPCVFALIIFCFLCGYVTAWFCCLVKIAEVLRYMTTRQVTYWMTGLGGKYLMSIALWFDGFLSGLVLFLIAPDSLSWTGLSVWGHIKIGVKNGW